MPWFKNKIEKRYQNSEKKNAKGHSFRRHGVIGSRTVECAL